VQRYCPAQVVGDDAAVLAAPEGQLVVTTDVLVEGVHFSDLTTPAHAVGWRAVAANLSDLAAMGSRPQALVVGLGLPGSTPVAWVEELYQGMRDCCARWECQLVGGDLCRSRIDLWQSRPWDRCSRGGPFSADGLNPAIGWW
jgi:Thiamine monophosphate kinase